MMQHPSNAVHIGFTSQFNLPKTSTPLSLGIEYLHGAKCCMVHADQALDSLHSCNVGVATPIFFMSNIFAETTQILVIVTV